MRFAFLIKKNLPEIFLSNLPRDCHKKKEKFGQCSVSKTSLYKKNVLIASHEAERELTKNFLTSLSSKAKHIF